ncbi:hypothetical protein PIB30_013180 [Stylosanthes scabra]|uniref:Uncharacterized protein n=1 Tax=Stylosanthes scabra TaxID=79078 RepID=A0ABU6Z5X0_9FABA|nr:hypothetical protein [Stylosanthes scabra]
MGHGYPIIRSDPIRINYIGSVPDGTHSKNPSRHSPPTATNPQISPLSPFTDTDGLTSPVRRSSGSACHDSRVWYCASSLSSKGSLALLKVVVALLFSALSSHSRAVTFPCQPTSVSFASRSVCLAAHVVASLHRRLLVVTVTGARSLMLDCYLLSMDGTCVPEIAHMEEDRVINLDPESPDSHSIDTETMIQAALMYEAEVANIEDVNMEQPPNLAKAQIMENKGYTSLAK